MRIKIMLKNKIFNTIFLIITTLYCSTTVKSQDVEYITPLSSNFSPVKTIKKKATRDSSSPLSIPFFDDFAHYNYGLADSLWINQGAFVNNSYSKTCPTVGIITLDAINNEGKIYPEASTTPFKADIISSKPINLSFQPADSVYLSFEYQPQGSGDNPEEEDILYVDFLDINTNSWDRIWSVNGSTSADFKVVMIPIKSTKYLQSGFQFRIGNYASLQSGGSVPNLKSNVDHWNIDLIYLNKNRNYLDTLINDVAINSRVDNIMDSYTALPIHHLTSTTSNIAFLNPRSLDLHYSNISNTTQSIRRYTIITDVENNKSDGKDGGWSYTAPKTSSDYQHTDDYNFVRPAADSATFRITSFIETFSPITSVMHQRLLLNDTITKTIKLKKEYAYDDGTAESGFGLKGNNIINSTVALKFNALQKDTISAVSFFFNNVYKQPRQDRFKLMVWADNNGVPGKILYQSESELIPDDQIGMNKFAKYNLDKAIIVEGNFYVGWKQLYDEFLNVGFDVNNNQSTKTFNNFGNGWNQSKEQGVCMIRVEFDKAPTESPTTGICKNIVQKLSAYPNPTSGFTQIQLPNSIYVNDITYYAVYDISGRIRIKENFANESVIDLNTLPQGIYFIRIFDKNEIVIGQSKIIKR